MSSKMPLQLRIVPLDGPVSALNGGFELDLAASPRFVVSRFPRVGEARVDAELGQFEGAPCLYLRDRLVSYPNAEIVRDGDDVRIRVAHEQVRNPLFINAGSSLRPDAGVREATLAIGDIVQIGTSRFRIDRTGGAAWQHLFAKAYPDLTWVSLIVEQAARHHSVHQCTSKEGVRVDVECRSFPGPVAASFRQSEEMCRRLTALREHVEGDAALQPWLPRLYDVRRVESSSSGTHVFVAREAINLRTFAAQLSRAEPLPVPLALRFATRLCEAVHRFHNFGLHGQLTPDAVWWAAGKTPAQDRLLLGELFETRTAASGGAVADSDELLAWRPPEMLDQGEYTERSEQYAVGLLIATALAGAPLLTAGSPEELRHRIVAGAITLPTSLPPKLKAVLGRALAVAPGQRFRGLLDLRAQLSRLADE